MHLFSCLTGKLNKTTGKLYISLLLLPLLLLSCCCFVRGAPRPCSSRPRPLATSEQERPGLILSARAAAHERAARQAGGSARARQGGWIISMRNNDGWGCVGVVGRAGTRRTEEEIGGVVLLYYCTLYTVLCVASYSNWAARRCAPATATVQPAVGSACFARRGWPAVGGAGSAHRPHVALPPLRTVASYSTVASLYTSRAAAPPCGVVHHHIAAHTSMISGGASARARMPHHTPAPPAPPAVHYH